MCELLIGWDDLYQHPDPFTAQRDNIQPYDIIVMRPDEHLWGRKESKQEWIASGETAATWHNRTALVKIPGFDCSLLRDLIGEQINVFKFRTARRGWNIKKEDFNAILLTKIRTIINDTGILNIITDLKPNERNTLRNAVRNKETGLSHGAL